MNCPSFFSALVKYISEHKSTRADTNTPYKSTRTHEHTSTREHEQEIPVKKSDKSSDQVKLISREFACSFPENTSESDYL